MWVVGHSDNLYNLDHLKRIYICKSSEVEDDSALGDRHLREFAVCGIDARTDKPIILRLFDTYNEAEMEILHLYQRLHPLNKQ